MKEYKVIPDPVLYPEKVEVGKKLKVLDVSENLEFLLEFFNCSIKYNLMTRKREISFPNFQIPPEDIENNALSIIEELATLNFMPVTNIDKWLSLIANRHTYHPIVEMIKNNPWDGVNRLEFFLMSIDSTNPEFDRKIIKTWMVQAIAAAHTEDGFVNTGVLVLQGDQGIGKTSWVRSLNPLPELPCIRDNFLLDPKDKDSVTAANSHWILELGELDATFNRSDIARLKGFITSPADSVRLPFAKKHIIFKRRSAYIATVNDDSYLVDKTGNRRWWTISCTNADFEHGFDMIQVWAQVYSEWKNGHKTYLDKETQKEMNLINEDHTKLDLLEEAVLEKYNWSSPERKELTVSEILYELNWPKIDQGSANNLSRILAKLNGKKSRRTKKKRLHEVPKYVN